MKKTRISILFFILSLFFVFPFTTLAKDNQDILGALNEKLKKDFADYKGHSVEIIDSLKTSTEVTEGDAKETRNIQVIFVQAKKVEVRDTIFYFDAKQIYYYDLDHKKLIDSSSVRKNEQIEKFVNKYKDDVGKEFNVFSLTIFMIALFITITAPPLLGIVFKKDSSSLSYRLQFQYTNSGVSKN
jgi:chloramphenicol O-acetyltransferase